MTAIATTIRKLLAQDKRAEAIDYLERRGGHAAAVALLKAGHDLYSMWLLEDMAPTNDTLPPPAGWADGANA